MPRWCGCFTQDTAQPSSSRDDSSSIERSSFQNINGNINGGNASKDLNLRSTPSESLLPHACRICNTEWPMPREIHWAQTAPDGLLKVKPTTLETIVVCQTFDPKTKKPMIPPSVYETFTFAREQGANRVFSRELVSGIRYSKPAEGSDGSMPHGKICRLQTSYLEESQQLDEYAYLRLITLNNWYASLFNAVLSVTFLVSEFQANAMLSASFMSDDNLIDALGRYRFGFITVWLLLLMVSVYYAYREASVNWIMKSSPAKGDLISDYGFVGRMTTFLAMIVFELCLLEKDVKDIVITLHPWKGVQDFSAFKSEGHRAYFVGFRSKTMHRAENRLSIWHCLPQQLFTRIVVMGFKLYLIIVLFRHGEKYSVSYSLLSSAGISVVSVLWDTWTLIETYNIRSKFFHRLINRLGKEIDTSSRQYIADIRMLALHFRRTWDAKRKRARRLNRQELREADWVSSGHARKSLASGSTGSGEQAERIYCNACGRCAENAQRYGSKSSSKSSNPKLFGQNSCDAFKSLSHVSTGSGLRTPRTPLPIFQGSDACRGNSSQHESAEDTRSQPSSIVPVTPVQRSELVPPDINQDLEAPASQIGGEDQRIIDLTQFKDITADRDFSQELPGFLT